MELKEQIQEELSAGIEVVSLQPVSLVDHVCKVDPSTLRTLIADELGGSHRVELSEIQRILATVGEYFSKAGGSASNTMRGLAGFGVRSRLVGARGYAAQTYCSEQYQFFPSAAWNDEKLKVIA